MRRESVYTRNDLASSIAFWLARATLRTLRTVAPWDRTTKGKTRLTLSNYLALVKVNGTIISTKFKSYKIFNKQRSPTTFGLLLSLDYRIYQVEIGSVSIYGSISDRVINKLSAAGSDYNEVVSSGRKIEFRWINKLFYRTNLSFKR